MVVIIACENRWLAVWALQVSEEMRLQGIQPNLITYTKVISACLMRWIIILHTYSALISACGEGIVPDRALKLSDKMRKDTPSPIGSPTAL